MPMRIVNNNRGAILFFVIICTVILALLGSAVVYMNGTEEIFSRDEYQEVQAMYLAEAGIERAKKMIYHELTSPGTNRNEFLEEWHHPMNPGNDLFPVNPATGTRELDAVLWTNQKWNDVASSIGSYSTSISRLPENGSPVPPNPPASGTIGSPEEYADYVITSVGVVTGGFTTKRKSIKAYIRVRQGGGNPRGPAYPFVYPPTDLRYRVMSDATNVSAVERY